MDFDLTAGLHHLKNDVKNVAPTEAGDLCRRIAKSWSIADRSTRDAVQRRASEFRLDRPHTKVPEDAEARLERACWVQWGLGKKKQSTGPFLDEVCDAIVSYQVPVFGASDREGWGPIDLLGVAPNGLPVVVELKAGGSEDSLLSGVLQAAAYGLAISELWTSSRLRNEWTSLLEGSSRVPIEAFPGMLESVPLVVAAPPQYWEAQVTDEYRESLDELLRVMRNHHLPCMFATVTLEVAAL